MSSLEKPPLPSISVVGKRPGLFCLDFHTAKECETYNREQDRKNKQAWKEFHEKLATWKSNF